MLSIYDILPGHTLPTRESNCLDHFMIKINSKNVLASTAILHTIITDYYYIIIIRLSMCFICGRFPECDTKVFKKNKLS